MSAFTLGTPLGWQFQQVMLRIKDPKASVAFYQDLFQMTLISHISFPQWKFDLYFLAQLPTGETFNLDPKSPEAQKYLWDGVYGGKAGTVLELTHNYGTEDLEGQVYHPGNLMECAALGKGRDGFGHIAFNTNDVYAACDVLQERGVKFQKLPDEGRMKGLAFALDPDGYWVEIVSRGGSDGPIENLFNFSQCMLRVKDAKKSIEFYERCGMKLVLSNELSGFSLHFLATFTDEMQKEFDEAVLSAPEGTERVKQARVFLKNMFVPVIELTHNHGTEDDKDFKYYSGNEKRDDSGSDGRGFGHVGFIVNDVAAACAELEPLGYGFKKKVGEGGMTDIAFAYDPDGYWVEIVPRGWQVPAGL